MGPNILSILMDKEALYESTLVQEFIREGELIAARAGILRVLDLRFKDKLGKDAGDTLASITDLERLDELFDLALKVRRLSQFRKAISSS
jgi:hypothetical protein